MTPDCIRNGVASYWEGGVATGAAWVSFRAFDERAVAALSVAVAGCATCLPLRCP